jgi:ABC-2 type transport system permease protein
MILKKLRILVSAQHALMLTYRAEIYLWVIAHVWPFVMMSIWMTAAGASKDPGMFAMSPVEYARYFAAVFAIRQFTAVWMIYEFEWHILEGRLSPMLLRPMNVLWHYVSAHLGEQLARLPFFFVMFALFFVIYPQALGVPPWWAVPMGIVAIYCAFALRFALQFCFCTLTFWFERASSIDQLTWLPYLFLSGFAIPLADMPEWARQILYLTPFPYCIDFPARILTGKLAPGLEMAQGFGIMALWFTGLLAIGRTLWKRGLVQYSGHGA